MIESVDAEGFQQRMWEMFSVRFQGNLSLPQLDRVRWHLRSSWNGQQPHAQSSSRSTKPSTSDA
jgi:hypothetical protein